MEKPRRIGKYEVVSQIENIGARRLHTVMERLLEDVSFSASEQSGRVVIDAAYVDLGHLAALAADEDLTRYIL